MMPDLVDGERLRCRIITMRKLLLISALILTACTSTEYNDFANPSPENLKSTYGGLNDYRLCNSYFGPYALLRNKEFNYRYIKIVVAEVKKRNLDCNSFPELSNKEAWMEDWIKEYEESLKE